MTGLPPNAPLPCPRIAIIGGGPGGLMSAYLLQKRAVQPLNITLFEASERLGGKLMTRTFDSAPHAVYEAGAAEFYDYSPLGPDPLRELIEELGLTPRPMHGAGALIENLPIRNPGDLRQLGGSAVADCLQRFDRMARKEISPADYYESDWREDQGDPLARKSFAQLLAEVPHPLVRHYLRVVTHSDLACEPHQTNATYGLQNYLLDDPDYMHLYGIDGGNEKLTQELARRISATILKKQPVQRVTRHHGVPGYVVESSGAAGERREVFDWVIVALPLSSLPSIRWEGASLTECMERHHQFYDHPAHYLRVTALFDRPFWRDQMKGSFFMVEAFGGTCLYDESSRFDAGGCGVLGWLIAGSEALRLSNLPDETLVSQVVESLPRALQRGAAQLLEWRVHRWANAVNALPGGFPPRNPDERHLPDPEGSPELLLVGDYLFDATINGVLDSADAVTEHLLSQVQSACLSV